MPLIGHWYIRLLVAAFWVAVIALTIWAIRSIRPSADQSASALSILNDRFARGEIDRPEYEQRKTVLRRR
jgi:putative membrane protein